MIVCCRLFHEHNISLSFLKEPNELSTVPVVSGSEADPMAGEIFNNVLPSKKGETTKTKMKGREINSKQFQLQHDFRRRLPRLVFSMESSYLTDGPGQAFKCKQTLSRGGLSIPPPLPLSPSPKESAL
jgi:hypothetical protein